jgi:myo-inositol 2-dehydrogenase / D-chiro-inositol 1-dehydrogenase
VYQYPEQVLKNPLVDACIVAVPDHQHYDVACQVIDSRRDLFLEKPISFTIEEGQDLVRRVRRRRTVMQVGTQQRSDLYFRRVCELVRQGKIGKLQHMEVRLPQDSGVAQFEPMPVPANLDYDRWLGSVSYLPYTEQRVHPQADFSRTGWMQVEHLCAGMITNWGSHMIDIAQWGSGTEHTGPVRVRARSTYEDRGIWTVHTAIEGELEYADGLKLDLVSLPGGDARKPGVRFSGTDGWLDVVRGSFEAHERELLRWEPEPGAEILQVSRNHYADFLQATASRKDPVAPVEPAHRANTVCLLIAEAAKTGKELRWDPGSERQV